MAIGFGLVILGSALATRPVRAGTADPRTRFSEAQQMFTLAAEPKSFFPVPGADHEDLHRYLGARYEQLILEFLAARLK